MRALREAEDVLHRLKHRYFLLVAIQNEVARRFGRRRLPVHNDHVWTMVFDSRDALALHFASWSKAMLGAGGLFGQLNAHRSALYVPRPKAKNADHSRDVVWARRDTFERLFPSAVTQSKVTNADVDRLRDRFAAVTIRIRNDRSKTLAHLYERDAQLGRRLVTPRGYRHVFARLERMFNDLRVVIADSSRDYSDTSLADVNTVAQDVVDMALGGTISQVLYDFGIAHVLERGEPQYYWQFRERYLAAERKSRRKRDAG